MNKEISGVDPMLDWGVYDLSFHIGLLSHKPQLKNIDSPFLKLVLDKANTQTYIYDIEEHFVVMLQFSEDLKYYWELAAHYNVGQKPVLNCHTARGIVPKFSFFDVEDDARGKARQQTMEVVMSKHRDDDFALAEHLIVVFNEKTLLVIPIELKAKHLDINFKIYKIVDN